MNAETFILEISDLLCFIMASVKENDAHINLVTHLLNKLWTSIIPVFQQEILKWQAQYLEGELQLTPLTLLDKTEQKSQVLKHARQWVETICPLVMALTMLFMQSQDGTSQVVQKLTANISSMDKKHQ
jgi:hypothetical protein